MPKVSVIIPNYNHALYLKQRIDSVLDQTYQDFELIILDDCSTDNSREIIEQYRRHQKVSHVVYNEVNSGSTFKQWKKGISLTIGEYVWIAESDDTAKLDFLKIMTVPLLNYPVVGLVFCQSYQYTHDNQITSTWIHHTKDVYNYNWENDFKESGKSFVQNAMLLQNAIVNASAVLFRKSIFDQNDFINISMTLNGDWLLYIKCMLNNDVFYINTPLNFFRFHLNKGSSTNIKNYNNVKEYYIILLFIFKNFEFSSNMKIMAKRKAFGLWYYQNGGKLSVTLKKQFFPILKVAFLIDKIILIRFMFAIFRQLFKFITTRIVYKEIY